MRISDWSSDVCSSDLPITIIFCMRKTTGGQHDAATGKNALRTVLAADLDALDCRSVVDELIQLRIEQYRDTELLQAVIHPGDERVHHRAAGADRKREEVGKSVAERVGSGGGSR